jgi:DNA-binding NtrC family response regulator
VDVRVITATNRDLAQEVKEGRFREDLFWRLNVVKIVLPPLRERPEDIPLLVEHFIEFFNQEHGKNAVVSPRAMTLLTNYSWPGNVRQLRTTIESLVILTTGREIAPRNLPDEIHREASPSQTVKLRVGTSLRDAEKELIRATLAAHNGNKALAARVLGLGRKTLYRKLEEYAIE